VPDPSGRSAARTWARIDGALRVSGALLGTLPPSVLACAALAAVLPVSPGAALATGVLITIPVWVAAMCAGFLARRGWLLWIVCLAATAALAAAVPDAAFWPDLPG
jgi:hypothetical protein